jgi:hypothetical protein
MAGEQLPIAKIPAGIPFAAGMENVYAGRASFYSLRYGPYLVGMNTTTDKTYDLEVPDDAKSAKALIHGGTDATAGSTVKVGPRSARVYYLGD